MSEKKKFEGQEALEARRIKVAEELQRERSDPKYRSQFLDEAREKMGDSRVKYLFWDSDKRLPGRNRFEYAKQEEMLLLERDEERKTGKRSTYIDGQLKMHHDKKPENDVNVVDRLLRMAEELGPAKPRFSTRDNASAAVRAVVENGISLKPISPAHLPNQSHQQGL